MALGIPKLAGESLLRIVGMVMVIEYLIDRLISIEGVTITTVRCCILIYSSIYCFGPKFDSILQQRAFGSFTR